MKNNSIFKMIKKPNLAILAAICALMAFTMPIAAEAMTVTPVIIDMKTAGRDAAQFINVNNTGASDIPIGIAVNEGIIGEDGKVTQTPIDDQFVIFPAQAVIKPGATQRFRVQYIGDPALSKGRTFIFTVSQQPVALPQGVSGIQILYAFEVVASVAPVGAKPELSVQAAGFDTTGPKRRAAITMNNAGAAHGYLSGTVLTLRGIDSGGKTVWTRNFEQEKINSDVGMGLVQPQSTRRFVLPFELPEGGETLSASIRYVGRR